MTESTTERVSLVVLRPFIYNGRALEAGDEFDPDRLGGVPVIHQQRLQRRRRIGHGPILRPMEELEALWAKADAEVAQAAYEARVEGLTDAERVHFEALETEAEAQAFLDAPPEERAVQVAVERRLRWQQALDEMDDEDEQAYFRGLSRDEKEAYLALDEDERLEALAAWLEEDEGGEDEGSAFVFDPERHRIEATGGWQHYVVEGDTRVHGPLTKADAEALQARAAP